MTAAVLSDIKLKTETSNFVSIKPSEETRHLDLDAKHNPMLGWLLPWGARRLRFNGDTEGTTLSVCSLPSLHTTSPLLLSYLFLSHKHRCRRTLLHSHCYTQVWAHKHTHKHVCAPIRCFHAHTLTHLETHTLSEIWQKLGDWQMKSTGVWLVN